MNSDFDCKLAGVVMALMCGMDGEARERVTEALETFAEDRHTPLSEAMFYRDLAESIAPPQFPVGGLFEQLETLH
jgi:hypothetical protein